MKLFLGLMLAVAMSGCASKKIIIDKDGVDLSRYDQDLETCKQYAEEVETGSEAAMGAVGGAVGAILGGRRWGDRCCTGWQ